MERKRFLKHKFNDALLAQERFTLYQENYNRLKSDKSAPCPDYRNKNERKIEVIKLPNYCEPKYNDSCSNVYNIYRGNFNKVKSDKNAFCPKYKNKNEIGMKTEVPKLSNECDSKSNGISRENPNSPSHFESRQEIDNYGGSDLDVCGSASTVSLPDTRERTRYNVPQNIQRDVYQFQVERRYPEQEIDNSGGSDLDVSGSASTVSFPDTRGRRRYNVPQKIQREPYPVHIVRPRIIIKKKEPPKEKFTVVQKGNFFEIVSLTPKSNKPWK